MDKGNHTKEKKISEFKKNILLLIIVVLVFFLVFEIILRITGYPIYGFQEGAFVNDEAAGYKLANNYEGIHYGGDSIIKVSTNSKGQRDFREYSYEKDDKTRILVLGDSFSFGNGVELEDSYVELLRKNFEEDKSVEIINLGVPGYDLHNELFSFLEEGKKYDPNIILLQFTLNDWGEHKIIEENGELKIDKEDTYRVDNEGFLVHGRPSNRFTLHTTHLFLLKKVKVYNFIYSKLRLALSPLIDKYWAKSIPPWALKGDSLNYQRFYNIYYNMLEELRKSTDVEIIILIGPTKEDFVSAEEIKEAYSLNYLVDTSQVKGSIKSMGKEINITTLEIEFEDEGLFLRVDKHWTPEGNKIVADELYSELNKIIKTEK